jgi:CRISPR/Cas system-associated endonuclease Cas3-HD
MINTSVSLVLINLLIRETKEQFPLTTLGMLQKIGKGSEEYQEGKTWHPELSDKAENVKTHVYWSMKN